MRNDGTQDFIIAIKIKNNIMKMLSVQVDFSNKTAKIIGKQFYFCSEIFS